MSLLEAETAVRVTHVDTGRHEHRAWRVLNGIVTSLVTIAVAVFAVLTVTVAVASHFSPSNEYVVFGHPVMSVLSGSMSPTISAGDLVIDDKVTADEAGHLRVGQIITFKESGTGTKTHRITGIDTAADGTISYRTKGDVNNVADVAPVAPSSVVGVFHSRIRFGGYVLNALHRPLVLWLLLAAPLLWFMSEPLRRWARELEETDGQSPATAGEAEGDAP